MKIVELVDAFWEWTGDIARFKGQDISKLPIIPFDFPLLSEMQRECATVMNQKLSDEEVDAFLTCMAVDNEDEYILQQCMEYADDLFLTHLVSNGIRHAQSEARWQMAELLHREIPDRRLFLEMLCVDTHPYVRKRAMNVMCDIEAASGTTEF